MLNRPGASHPGGIAEASSSRAGRLGAGLLALALGVIFIGITGFAPMDAVHNAAHDGRHAFAFPCH